jgi:hypothetical protein
MSTKVVFSAFGFLLAFLISCTTPQKIDSPELQKFSEDKTQTSAKGCLGLMDNYCSELYSPKASGNLVIERHKPIQIMEGETANQFSEVFFRYSMAKIKNKRYLPADFLSILDRYNYFDKLDDFIHRRPIPKMSLE